MVAGFIKTPEPIMLPAMMAVADQKPIFLESGEKDIKEKDNQAGCINKKLHPVLVELKLICFLVSTRISNIGHTYGPDTRSFPED